MRQDGGVDWAIIERGRAQVGHPDGGWPPLAGMAPVFAGWPSSTGWPLAGWSSTGWPL